ncbi:hypothetical protein E1200_02875 [Actinomadura sp. GC306]|uniref:hypothetical protein n=1 Tax=Actinomadura sp. GC306 TaxID=2530367 RepID=UPI0010EDA16D|nr:hypothetical protein [Actinomadura sp. GC306]TDC71191.1 hypothetical protein E1200_02875 [Actinomadura sp. GC306]
MSTNGETMNELPYMAVLALRHEAAGREYARLTADIVEARLIARARSAERAARRRALLRERLGALRPERRARGPELHCARAAARAGGAR